MSCWKVGAGECIAGCVGSTLEITVPSSNALHHLGFSVTQRCQGDEADKLACGAQGLFHPARKVRETYWKIYNNLYIGAQDTLVACYPRLDDHGVNTYARQELDLFL